MRPLTMITRLAGSTTLFQTIYRMRDRIEGERVLLSGPVLFRSPPRCVPVDLCPQNRAGTRCLYRVSGYVRYVRPEPY